MFCFGFTFIVDSCWCWCCSVIYISLEHFPLLKWTKVKESKALHVFICLANILLSSSPALTGSCGDNIVWLLVLASNLFMNVWLQDSYELSVPSLTHILGLHGGTSIPQIWSAQSSTRLSLLRFHALLDSTIVKLCACERFKEFSSCVLSISIQRLSDDISPSILNFWVRRSLSLEFNLDSSNKNTRNRKCLLCMISRWNKQNTIHKVRSSRKSPLRM